MAVVSSRWEVPTSVTRGGDARCQVSVAGVPTSLSLYSNLPRYEKWRESHDPLKSNFGKLSLGREKEKSYSQSVRIPERKWREAS